MPHLDIGLNNQANWQNLLLLNERRVEIDLDEVERVIELARRTPGLSEHRQGLRQLSVFFRIATEFYLEEEDPSGLVDLVAFWERYRAAVIQRYTAVTPVELRAADRVVENIFDRFIESVPNENLAYSPNAQPLVYGGEGGLGAYFTHPPGWNRPFAIINLPHAAFDNVWQWLALPHETGHDFYATVTDLSQQVEDALEARMRQAVQNSEIDVMDVRLDLNQFGVNHVIDYSGEDFLVTLWRSWANEAQADIIGLLSCGGAAPVALQQIVGFSATDQWELSEKPDGTIEDRPEVHPTPYVRNALNIAALRRIGGHEALVQEIEQRFHQLRPAVTNITWHLGQTLVLTQVPVADMERSAEIAAEVLVDHPLAALGGQSYSQVANFTVADQQVVDQITPLLVEGDPTFMAVEEAEPRHALAATIFAFEDSSDKADVINRTFGHFV